MEQPTKRLPASVKQAAWLTKIGADPSKFTMDMATVLLSVYFGMAKLDLDEQDIVKEEIVKYLLTVGHRRKS